MNEISFKEIAYVLGTSVLAIFWLIAHVLGLIAYSEIFVVNFIAMSVALYVAISIVVEGGLRKLLTVLAISFLAVIISDLCFYFLQPFIALCISLVVLLVIIKYFLIRDHDSGWFGALCAELIGLIFFSGIEVTLALIPILIELLGLSGF